MENNDKLSGNISFDRRTKILEILEVDGQAKVSSLSNKFNVSSVTIRNDLEQLEKKGLVIRTRGGALKAQKVGIDYNLETKRKKNHIEKELIGKKAAALVGDGETIILDSGTTTMEIAKNLQNIENLTVISNALNIVSHLVNLPNVKVIVPGGYLRKESLSLIGYSAEEELKNYYCDKLFIGVDGIDATYGISTPNAEEAHLNKAMISIAKEIFVVADSSKFLKRSFAFISTLDEITSIITDANIPEHQHKALLNMGVNVIIAE
ncbi:MAG: DeoR/GlpR family DNA-binding transcription regulator [Bacteroidetes bacterium]|nr:DeoR/GlpR family DNA-binding transcription regulator [Bacteroidota bacterium]MBU1117051.1 DeoR/GlpR family DNA-binding transcription regulator [Bacteroidota bacterium]MBU1797646.1 DeoR/GlpR family DNA-binding transcription regulator [Bacteroidota bacterium]